MTGCVYGVIAAHNEKLGSLISNSSHTDAFIFMQIPLGKLSFQSYVLNSKADNRLASLEEKMTLNSKLHVSLAYGLFFSH